MVFEYESIYKFDIYVILTIPQLETLQEQLWDLSENYFWNYRAKFLISIVGESLESSIEIVKNIFIVLWKYYKLWDIVLLVPVKSQYLNVSQTEISSKIELYGWNPYVSHTQCTEPNKIIHLDTWNLQEGGFLRKFPLFSYQIPNTLHGCPLRATALDLEPFLIAKNGNGGTTFTGFDQRIIHLISQMVNMSIEYRGTLPGNRIEVRVNAMQDLLVGATDIICGGYILHIAATPFADPLMSYMENTVKWYVPCGTPIPRIEKISQMFKLNVWMMVVVQIILSVIFISNISKRTSKLSSVKSSLNISSTIFIVLSILLGVSISKMPFGIPQRILFISLIWYAFALSTIFQSLFTSILVDPGYYDQIRLLDELIDSEFIYYYDETVDDFMNFTIPEYYNQVKLERKRAYQDDLYYVNYFENNNAVLICFDMFVQYFMIISLPPGTDVPRMCTLDQDILIERATMYMAKGSPLFERFNSVLLRALESGIVEKLIQIEKASWRENSYNWTKIYSDAIVARNDNKNSEEYFIFSLSHLKFIFYILCLSYLLGIVILSGEIIVSYCKCSYTHERTSVKSQRT
ncbi:hypothetical protein L9F63_019950 [Diploptera punctata]|uniref:Uncharacterized protein n=1 Tax=Diploptera punctata TaxID=6984 RepID=A0AAD8EDK6_DIPPU|nr:hypothetical protein L9F63_019950 [Diploptera punctata]